MTREVKTIEDRFDDAIIGMAEALKGKLSDVGINAYQRALRDIPIEAIEWACDVLTQTERFMPSPVVIREMCGVTSPEGRAVLAWATVEKATRIGSYRSVDFDDHLTNATIRTMGGWPSLLVRTPEEFDKWSRQEFIKTYCTLMRSGVDGDMCGPLQGLSDQGVHDVVGGDGTIRQVRLNPPTRITTGLPALPNSARPAITRDPRGAGRPAIAFRSP